VLPAQKEPPSGLCGNRTLVGDKTKKEQYGPPCLTPNKEGNRNNKKYIQQICGKNLYNRHVKNMYNRYVKKNIYNKYVKKNIYNKYVKKKYTTNM